MSPLTERKCDDIRGVMKQLILVIQLFEQSFDIAYAYPDDAFGKAAARKKFDELTEGWGAHPNATNASYGCRSVSIVNTQEEAIDASITRLVYQYPFQIKQRSSDELLGAKRDIALKAINESIGDSYRVISLEIKGNWLNGILEGSHVDCTDYVKGMLAGYLLSLGVEVV
jgi:hypothetical protein